MIVMRLRKFLTASKLKVSYSQLIFWFSLSLTVDVIYGIGPLQTAFSSEYIVQDDARVYVFWMQRFLDPDLLSHDLIADYYQSVTPFGYATLYRLMAAIGIHPLLFSKLLPLALGLVATGYCFGVCMQSMPIPTASFISTLLLNQSLWMQDDLISATPRAFVYPLFLAFLYYLLRHSLLPCLIAIALEGLFYPPFVLIFVGILILRLWRWEMRLPRLSQNRSDYLFCATGLGVALLVMLPYTLGYSEFGPTVTAAQARTWPEFLPKGRIPFFIDTPWKYWFSSTHSSIRLSLNPPLLATGFFLPILLRYPSRFPKARQITSEVTLLLQILLASLGWFFAAHAILFKLYLPSRYTQHSLRILISIAAGSALTLILDAIWQWFRQLSKPRNQGQQFRSLHPGQVLSLAAIAIIWLFILLYPSFFWKNYFPRTSSYVIGGVPELYKFFLGQPKNIRIASLAEEANNLPTFSHRSIVVARAYADPYHVGYYNQIRQRANDLIRAQYTPDLALVQNIVRKYEVDFWLLERTAFTPKYITTDRWLQQYKLAATGAVDRLQQGTIPALSSLMKSCSVFEIEDFVVLNAACIAQASSK